MGKNQGGCCYQASLGPKVSQSWNATDQRLSKVMPEAQWRVHGCIVSHMFQVPHQCLLTEIEKLLCRSSDVWIHGRACDSITLKQHTIIYIYMLSFIISTDRT